MAKKNNFKGLPEEFLSRLAEIAGHSLFGEIQKTFVERPTTFRVNTIKTFQPKADPCLPDRQAHRAEKHKNIKTILEEKGFKLKQVSWYKDAFVLMNKSKRELMETPQYISGEIYLQSLASMVPPLVLEPKAGEKVLDLTAAPGSKTSQIAAMMERTGELVANDMDKVRFFKLQHTMELLGVDCHCEERSHSEVTKQSMAMDPSPQIASSPAKAPRNDSACGWHFTLRMEPGWKLCSEYPEGYFDKILLDAPCSAEARFVRGERRTYGYWSERKIKEMVSSQWRLLLAAWYALRPGGTLVYSTCTFAPEENEYQISKFMEKVGNARLQSIDLPQIQRLPIVYEWNGKPVNKETKKCLRVFPTKEIEGFFVAKLVKKGA